MFIKTLPKPLAQPKRKQSNITLEFSNTDQSELIQELNNLCDKYVEEMGIEKAGDFWEEYPKLSLLMDILTENEK